MVVVIARRLCDEAISFPARVEAASCTCGSDIEGVVGTFF